MLERIAQTIERHRLFEPGRTVGVAVSGGADSVCLLHVLRELAPRWDLRLHVLHLNHRLRGAESDQDEAFVAQRAAEFGLPFTSRAAELAPGNLEQAAREARRAFFADVIASGAVACVATGHTRSDQAETVLFRFLRGAGTGGLAAIRPRTPPGIIRPLLEIDRAEVQEFLTVRGIPWRQDSSNQNLDFARNRIRHDLLPQLSRDWNPALSNSLSQTADWALAEEDYWQTEIDRLAESHLVPYAGSLLVSTERLKALPVAAARRLVRRAMERIRGDLRAIDFGHITAVLGLAATSEGHGRLQAPGLDVLRSFSWLRFARPTQNGLETRNYRFPATIPGILRIPGLELQICLELTEKWQGSDPTNSVYNNEMYGVNWLRVSGPLELRNWRPGDQYQPQGAAIAEKIKTLFQEFRVPLWERRHWPVLTDGSAIVWAHRFGPAADFAATPESAKILNIREMRIVPDQSGVYNDRRAGREGQ